MNPKTKRYFLASAGLAGVFLIGSLTQHPGSQAKGAYSTPVTVMNTTANAGVVRDEDSPGRNAFQIGSCSERFPDPASRKPGERSLLDAGHGDEHHGECRCGEG